MTRRRGLGDGLVIVALLGASGLVMVLAVIGGCTVAQWAIARLG